MKQGTQWTQSTAFECTNNTYSVMDTYSSRPPEFDPWDFNVLDLDPVHQTRNGLMNIIAAVLLYHPIHYVFCGDVTDVHSTLKIDFQFSMPL